MDWVPVAHFREEGIQSSQIKTANITCTSTYYIIYTSMLWVCNNVYSHKFILDAHIHICICICMHMYAYSHTNQLLVNILWGVSLLHYQVISLEKPIWSPCQHDDSGCSSHLSFYYYIHQEPCTHPSPIHQLPSGASKATCCPASLQSWEEDPDYRGAWLRGTSLALGGWGSYFQQTYVVKHLT